MADAASWRAGEKIEYVKNHRSFQQFRASVPLQSFDFSVSLYSEISPCPDDLSSNEDRPVNTVSQPARINHVMGNKVCDIIEVAAEKNCTPSASMSNLKCDPSGAVPGTVIPSVPDASVVNNCCTPSLVMPPVEINNFCVDLSIQRHHYIVASRVEFCDTRLAMIIKIHMHAHEKGFRSISVINFCHHGCLGH